MKLACKGKFPINMAHMVSALIRHFDPYKSIVATNVYVGDYEADFLVIRPSRWSDEIEVKLTLADFLADFRKDHGSCNVPKHGMLRHALAGKGAKPNKACKSRRFWFAVTEDIKDEVLPRLPKYAGLITVGRKGTRCYAKVSVQAPDLKYNTKKWTDAEVTRLYRKIYHRYWDRYKAGIVTGLESGKAT